MTVQKYKLLETGRQRHPEVKTISINKILLWLVIPTFIEHELSIYLVEFAGLVEVLILVEFITIVGLL